MAEERREVALYRVGRCPFRPPDLLQVGAGARVTIELQTFRFCHRRILRELAGGAKLLQQAMGVVLALLNIRLVKGIDAQKRPRGRRGHLPAEELLPQIERGGDSNPDDGMTS